MALTEDQKTEIAAKRAETTTTLRAVSPGMEAWLHQAIPVLDHGFIRVVDYMGDDAAIVQAARVSYGAGTKTARNSPPISAMFPWVHSRVPQDLQK